VAHSIDLLTGGQWPLRRPDLPAEVRSTLNAIKADLEQQLGHHIWLGEG
jgi:hypothetical protein